jgi:hypothetical protein
MAASMKMAVFWVIALCHLVDVYQHFRGASCLHHQGTLMMEAASISETLVNFYQTTWCSNSEDSHLRYILVDKLQRNRPIRRHARMDGRTVLEKILGKKRL